MCVCVWGSHIRLGKAYVNDQLNMNKYEMEVFLSFTPNILALWWHSTHSHPQWTEITLTNLNQTKYTHIYIQIFFLLPNPIHLCRLFFFLAMFRYSASFSNHLKRRVVYPRSVRHLSHTTSYMEMHAIFCNSLLSMV